MKTLIYTLALLLIGAGCFAQSKDEAAIKAVVEGHSQAILDADVG